MLWQVSDGACHSLATVSTSTGAPLWQHLPEGPADQLDFSHAVAWNNTLVYTLQGQPVAVATNTHNGQRRYQFPGRVARRASRALGLPSGSALKGPLASPATSRDLLILHSNGPSAGASSHLYAVDPATGMLVWQVDVAPVLVSAAAAAGLEADGEPVITDWMLADSNSVLLTVTSRHAMACGVKARLRRQQQQQQQIQQQQSEKDEERQGTIQQAQAQAGQQRQHEGRIHPTLDSNLNSNSNLDSTTSVPAAAGPYDPYDPYDPRSPCPSWGVALQLRLSNGSLAWASGALSQGLAQVAGSTDDLVVLLSEPDADGEVGGWDALHCCMRLGSWTHLFRTQTGTISLLRLSS